MLDPERGESTRDPCSAVRQVRKAHPRFALAAVEVPQSRVGPVELGGPSEHLIERGVH